MNVVYDHHRLVELRAAGWSWLDIVPLFPGSTAKALRQAHSVWRKAQADDGGKKDPPVSEVREESRTVAGQTFARMQSVEDVVAAFELDPTMWEAVTVKVGGSSWDQSVAKGHVASSVRIDATFRRIKFHEDTARAVFADLLADFEARTSAAHWAPPAVQTPGQGASVLAELAIFDPHFGMLAWGQEVGEDQDLKTIVEDYGATVERLVALSRIYPVERFLYVIGNDTSHANQSGEGGKGGTTKRGTQQDMDTRLAKIFTTVRRSVVGGIDLARTVAPVDVLMVPGNHDPDENYRLGEVLAAWYRSSPDVRVLNVPSKRKFYGYGRNVFMFTHGEEVTRKRDNLATIMATECPAALWVASEGGCREIHTGHNHRRLQGGYYPTAEVEENRGVLVRSLPGLTSTDAWHYEEGYKHRRAATLLAYFKDGGLAGLHEHQPLSRHEACASGMRASAVSVARAPNA